MGWQEQVALVGGELDENGLPAYREVVVTVPRQSGKTSLVLGWEVQRAVGWEVPQRIVYSAQSGSDARKKLIEDQTPILKRHKRALGIDRILSGMGNEAVEFLNGSRIHLLASTEESGHGRTIDLALKDEYFADYDDRRDQALIPAMVTRPAAQMLTTSTMGTEASIPLNRAVERGRAAVEAGRRDGIAYFEWSAEPGADPDDPDVWRTCMPALGITITEAVVRHARDNMTEDEFRRAFLNNPTGTDQRIIPLGTWDAVCDPTHKPVGNPVFGLDMAEDRSSTSIVAFVGGVAELVETGLSPSEAVQKGSLLGAKGTVYLDGRSPAASLADSLRANGADVKELTTQDMAEACGGFYDDVLEQAIKIRRHPALDAATANARKRTVGDAWVWARKGSKADVSPLIAGTVARWGAKQPIEAIETEANIW